MTASRAGVFRRERALAALLAAVLASVAAGPAHAQTTELISQASDGTRANGGSDLGAGVAARGLSRDGRFVAFYSRASTLVPGDTNGEWDVFLRDRQSGTTERLSVGGTGAQANGGSTVPAISADGRYVAFMSSATNLTAEDTRFTGQIYLRDRQAGTIAMVSVDGAGGGGNGQSYYPVLSADGRYVAFHSAADNLVAGDTNDAYDVFVYDRQSGAVERVSLDSAGVQGDAWCLYPAISADGRYVAFECWGDGLVAGDANGAFDVYLRDRSAGTTELVALDDAGNQANANSAAASLSADGRYVAFTSYADNLVAGDTNGWRDVFVRDRSSGTTQRVSLDSAGNQANGGSFHPAISADGRYVAFASPASSLVADGSDTAGLVDIFVRDRVAGTTERVSLNDAGAAANRDSGSPAITPDGRFVAFHSWASNLVAGDDNGTQDVFLRDRGAVPTSVFANVLPSSRSGVVGEAATAFAAMVNAGDGTATGCTIAPATPVAAGFSFRQTDPATNQPVGSDNQPADIAVGSHQTFVIAFTPSAAFAATDVEMTFDCANSDPAPSVVGLNSLLLSGNATPVPDVIAIVATTTNDGIAVVPGPSGTGFYTVAGINIGPTATLTVRPVANPGVPVALSVCETTGEPGGACKAAPAATVSASFATDTIRTFTVFVTGTGTPIPVDLANSRVTTRFEESGGPIRGATSVAVQTGPES